VFVSLLGVFFAYDEGGADSLEEISWAGCSITEVEIAPELVCDLLLVCVGVEVVVWAHGFETVFLLVVS
jgi:hypothetical protein